MLQANASRREVTRRKFAPSVALFQRSCFLATTDPCRQGWFPSFKESCESDPRRHLKAGTLKRSNLSPMLLALVLVQFRVFRTC